VGGEAIGAESSRARPVTAARHQPPGLGTPAGM